MAVIAIDGPAGSGKSTLSRALAAALDLAYVNTGLMYRALAAVALDQGVSPDDATGLATLAGLLVFEIEPSGNPRGLLINGERPGLDLAAERVEVTVSAVSRHPQVREVMVAGQRRLGAGGAVVEGRDIASVVFPDAEVKVFLAAPEGVRAARRVEERGGDEGAGAGLSVRDSKDARTNPPVPAAGAIEIDTTDKSAEQVCAEALALVRERVPGLDQGGS